MGLPGTRRHSLLLVGLLFSLSSSSGCHTVFTQGIRDSGVTATQLTQLRYYLCKEVTLARDVTESETQVAGTHALTIRNGRTIEYIVFRGGTVGAVVAAGKNWVDVKFERGPGRLRFMAAEDEDTPNEVAEFKSGLSIVVGLPLDAYRLAARDWDYGPMEMPWGMTETGWHGTITYGGEEYVAIESSFDTCLQIDSSSVHTETKSKRFVEGLDVTELQAEERERVRSAKKKRPAAGQGDEAAPAPAPRKPRQPAKPAREAAPVEED